MLIARQMLLSDLTPLFPYTFSAKDNLKRVHVFVWLLLARAGNPWGTSIYTNTFVGSSSSINVL